MNLTSAYARGIKQHGRCLQNLTTGEGIHGFLPAAGPAQFLPGTPVSVGDLLHDPVESKRYIVGDLDTRPECLYAQLIDYHLTCSISRHSASVNDFGRSAEPPVIVTANCPVVIQDGRRAAVPAGTPAKQGDVLVVDQTGEIFLVKAVSGDCMPGLSVLIVAKQSAAEFASSL